MSKAVGTREAWFPQSAEERDSVLRELQEIVASVHFCNSKRYPALLRYIVENTLNGRSDLLKERTLGVEVFDRPPTYDTNSDTVVRYTAGEVRKRLLLFYSERGRTSRIQISLPAGSYIPEFLLDQDQETTAPLTAPQPVSTPQGALDGGDPSRASLTTVTVPKSPSVAETATAANRGQKALSRGRQIAAIVTILLIVGTAGLLLLRYRAAGTQRDVSDFWDPVLHDQHSVLICTGGVVFQKNNFSGVITAGKDNEYPFVSMQIASAIAQISALTERLGASTQLVPAPTTPLSDLRDHPTILLGGYNNRWAMRLLQSRRFQFTPEPDEWIIDRMQPQVHWSRDRSLPYSSGDDYAILARFHDDTTGSWVVVLAGLGRNGTEAAAHFATSPHYMKILRDQIGQSFANHNIEAVLKVQVVDGKTGAPSLQTAYVW